MLVLKEQLRKREAEREGTVDSSQLIEATAVAEGYQKKVDYNSYVMLITHYS